MTLLIDLNNLLFRMLHVHKNLRYGGTYGFITLFSKYTNIHKPNYIYVCKDGPPYFKNIDLKNNNYEAYKSNRIKQTDIMQDYLENLKLVEQFLLSLNIPILYEKGYEADDLIAYVCKSYQDRQFIICSNDSDLYQLLTTKVSLQKNKELYSIDTFIKEYDIQPNLWEYILMLSGGHNGLNPIQKGMGIKTAIKLLKTLTTDKYLLLPTIAKELNIDLNILSFRLNIMKLPYQKLYDNIHKMDFHKKIFINTFYKSRQAINWIMEHGITPTKPIEDCFDYLTSLNLKKEGPTSD